MSELARTFQPALRGMDRRSERALGSIQAQIEAAELWVDGINDVTERAVYRTMLTSIVRKMAEELAPDGAELYAMITVAGAVESTRVINSMNRPRCRR